MTAETDDSGPWLFPIAIGEYKHFDKIGIDTEVALLEGVFDQFRVKAEPWPGDEGHRDKTAVDARLTTWSEGEPGRNAVMYWLGHGWVSGTDTKLAHFYSPLDMGTTGVWPADLAQAIGDRQRRPDSDGAWSFVIIDTCQSSAFVRNLFAILDTQANRAERYVLFGVSGNGETYRGMFREKLTSALAVEFAAHSAIPIEPLARHLEKQLQGSVARASGLDETATLNRGPQLVNTDLDTRAKLGVVLANLTEDQRRHFIPKAQGPETTEPMWFFEGREQTIDKVLQWLDNPDGMLVVTGAAGSGKSALLGHLFMLSQPELRALLVERHLIDEPDPRYLGFEKAFNAAILLTGATAVGVVARFAEALDLPDRTTEPDLQRQIDWLAKSLGDRAHATGRPVTVIVDALDEAAEPLEIARRVFPRLIQMSGVRLVVGTRRSTHDRPGVTDEVEPDILDALMRHDMPQLPLTKEPAAVNRYVGRVLEEGLPGTDRAHIRAAADAVSERQQEFLYARLAAHELLADPTLLEPGRVHDLDTLLHRDYEGLFAIAVDRLTGATPVNRALLLALATSESRGLPMLDDIWATVAEACARPGTHIVRDHITELLRLAEPYILLDIEHNQTVYRLAHRAFAELLADRGDAADRQHAVVRALLAATQPGEPLNRYVAAHLAGHAAHAHRAWQLIADRPDVLDRLDPRSVAAHAFHTGLSNVPSAVAGIAVMRQLTALVSETDRAGWRQIGMVQLGHPPQHADTDPWRVVWGAIAAHTPYLIVGSHLSGAAGTVAAVWSGDMYDLIVSGGDGNHTLRVWDPASPPGVNERLTVTLGAEVRSLTTLPTRDGATVVAVGTSDGMLSIIDPATGVERSWRTGHRSVLCLAVVPRRDGVAVVSGGDDDTLRLWNPATGEQIGVDWTGHTNGGVLCVGTFRSSDGRTRVVSGGTDGTLLLWDPVSGKPVGRPWKGHALGGVQSVATVPGPDGETFVVSGGSDGTMRLWDSTTGSQRAAWSAGLDCKLVPAIHPIPGPDDATLLASIGDDGILRFWDPLAGQQIGLGEDAGLRALAAVNGRSGSTLTVSAGDDGTVRLWDHTVGALRDRRRPRHAGQVLSVVAVTRPGRPLRVVSGGADGTLRLWDPTAAEQIGDAWRGHEAPVSTLCHLTLPGGRDAIVSGSHDSTLRLWDQCTGEPLGDPWYGLASRVAAVVAIPGPDGTTLVLSGEGDSTMRIWDPATGTVIRYWKSGSVGLRDIVAVHTPGAATVIVSAGRDRALRLWNTTTGKQIGTPWTIPGRAARGLAVLHLPDGTALVASAGDDATIRLWDPTTGAETATWTAGRGIGSVAAWPDPDNGTHLVFTGTDTLHLWDPATHGVLTRVKMPFDIQGMCVADGVITLATDEGVLAVDPRLPLPHRGGQG